ncbi:MAG: NADH-quinone oxidoreductase subunit C [Bacteroidales bacterium]
MMIESIIENIKSLFSDIKINIADDKRIKIFIHKEVVISVLSFLKNSGYNHLGLISCVDWMDENEFELIYILSSYSDDSEMGETMFLVKTRLPREKAEFYTVMNIFENAEPYERELHELYGLNFKGHPRLIPLLLERKYDTPPFRKDFDTRKYVKDFFDKIPSIEVKKE